MPDFGVRTRVLLTRSPLRNLDVIAIAPLDLHALSTPPAFILDQDQILEKNFTQTDAEPTLTGAEKIPQLSALCPYCPREGM